MHIILGATGRVGSVLAKKLLDKGEAVRAVVRNSSRAGELKARRAEVVTADYSNPDVLKRAFQGGNSVFLLTPEDPQYEDFIDETKKFLNSFREAVISAGITKIVGLSSMGAQHESGTGKRAWNTADFFPA